MTTKESSSDTNVKEQGRESSSSDADEMLTESNCETLSHEASTTVESGSQGCDADCCNLTRDKPDKPTDKHILASTKQMQGSPARYVQSNWFKQHTQLTLSVETHQNHIQVEPLKAQLRLIPDLIVRHKDVTMKKVTSI